MNFSSRLSPS